MYETSLRARIIPKVFIFLKIITFIFCLGHLIFSIIFFEQGAFIFCGYNILSTIFYAVLCHSIKQLTSKNTKAVANILTYIIIELSIFITVALLLVEDSYGFRHYIYGIFVFIMFENYLSNNTIKSVILTSFSCSCTFIPSLILYYIDSYYNFNTLSSAFDIVNSLVAVALFISYIFILGNIITNFEGDIIYQAYHDKLTGLHNRTLLSQLTFDSDNTYVAIFDIDDFKKVNDTFGHDAGDLVLKHLSKMLILEARANHGLHAIRWGGEEFVLVYNNDRNFLDIVNAIRDDILQSYVDIESRKIIYRITVGVADYEDGKDLEELIKVADERLYLGKKSGKNKIVYKG